MTNLRLRYQTVEFSDTDIHLCTLRDKQQFHDPDGTAAGLGISSASWSVFGVIWPSALVLAHCMDAIDTRGRRILEVGCGIALPSLLLNNRGADITATDRHPEASAFIARNTALNNDDALAYARTDWVDGDDDLGLFDLIIGSDLLYEDGHIDQLADFIDGHARPACEVILVDPGRGRKSRLITRMSALGYTSAYLELPPALLESCAFKGHIVKLQRWGHTVSG